jgi:hypothetical protein
MAEETSKKTNAPKKLVETKEKEKIVMEILGEFGEVQKNFAEHNRNTYKKAQDCIKRTILDSPENYPERIIFYFSQV